MFNHLEDKTVITLIHDLCTQITGEFNTDELLKLIAAIKDPLNSSHWTFTSLGVMIVMALMTMIIGLCIWKKCCGTPTNKGSSSGNYAP